MLSGKQKTREKRGGMRLHFKARKRKLSYSAQRLIVAQRIGFRYRLAYY